MTVDLFRAGRFTVRNATGKTAADAYQCLRCGSLVMDYAQHTKWHGATDSSATTEVGARHA